MAKWEVEREVRGKPSVTIIEADDLAAATALAGEGFLSVRLQADPEVEQARARAVTKLAALGLTEDEANAIVG